MARMARRKVTRTGAHKKKTKKIVLTDQEIAKRRAEDKALGEQLSRVKQYTVIAAGEPPHDLEGDTIEDVAEWIGKLKETKVNHTVQSCQFWVKYFFNPFDQKEQWKAVRKLIIDNHETLGLPNLPPVKYKDETKVENQGW
jgi:hypothetical protein